MDADAILLKVSAVRSDALRRADADETASLHIDALRRVEANAISSAGRQTSVARAYVLVSALLASTVTLSASYLTKECQLYAWCDVLFSSGTIGTAVSLLAYALQTLAHCRDPMSQPHPGSLLGLPEHRPWLLLRGFAGAVSILSVNIALSTLTVPVANAIMFTSPFFTMLLAFLFFGEIWRWFDSAMSALCICGVILVARPPIGLPDWRLAGGEVGCPAPTGGIVPPMAVGSTSLLLHSEEAGTAVPVLIGIAAAFSFSISLAVANLVIAKKVSEESITLTLTLTLTSPSPHPHPHPHPHPKRSEIRIVDEL